MTTQVTTGLDVKVSKEKETVPLLCEVTLHGNCCGKPLVTLVSRFVRTIPQWTRPLVSLANTVRELLPHLLYFSRFKGYREFNPRHPRMGLCWSYSQTSPENQGHRFF